MLRPTLIAFVDQALLSALSFALSLVLIRYAAPAEFGLYSQLLNLQSLFSVVHAGLFVSGLLALHSTVPATGRAGLAASLARADARFGLACAPLIAATTYVGAFALNGAISVACALASALAIIGLWWREFSRAAYFADLDVERALTLDLGYALVVAAALPLLALLLPISAGTVLLATGLGGVAAGGVALARFAGARTTAVTAPAWRAAWHHGQWDTYGSLVTWLQSQSYVYFAALAGGLAMAGSVSAARLLGMPLALAWASGANVLRVSVARGLATHEGPTVTRLVRRALVAVVALSAGYALLVVAAFPAADRLLYHHKFPDLRTDVAWWLAYFTLTGVSTTGAAVLRGALRMARLFRFYLVACGVTLAALGLLTLLHHSASIVAALAAGEVALSVLIWIEVHRLRRSLHAAWRERVPSSSPPEAQVHAAS